MKTFTLASIGLVWSLLLGFAVHGALQQRESVRLMTESAQRFLSTLDAEKKQLAQLPFDQDKRLDWHFIPKQTRKGLRLKDMSTEQQQMAYSLLNASLSRSGFTKATTIMSLEYLVLLEDQKRGRTQMSALRNPEQYYFTIFGQPADGKDWGWSVEGHHVSLNFTIVDGEFVASTPMFFGSEPHEVIEGDRKGTRVLGPEEDLARTLLGMLDDTQKAKAILGAQAPTDVFSANKRKIEFEAEPRGLQVTAMNAEQKKALNALIDEYIANVPPDMAAIREAQLAASGDSMWFAWLGSTTKGDQQGYYYRVQAKEFLIEFDCIQNDANHSHTVWRDYNGDFGADLLADHHAADAPARN